MMKKCSLFFVVLFLGGFCLAQEAAIPDADAAVAAAWEAALKAIDQNGDGKCSTQECNDFIEKAEAQLATLRQQTQLARLLRLDQNQDGVISKEELPEDNQQISNLFNRLDTDKNGKLDQEELKKLLILAGGRLGIREERRVRGQDGDRQRPQRQQRGERRPQGQGQNVERRGQRQQPAERRAGRRQQQPQGIEAE